MTHPVNRATFNKVLKSEFNFRLDSSYVLNYTLYIKILDALKEAGIVVEKASGLVKIRRESVSEAVTTATVLIKSLWKASIHPLKLEPRTHGSRYQCKELDIIGVATGLGSIGKFSVVPKYLKEIVKMPLATTGDLVILELKPDRPSEDSYYMVTLLNTKFGKLVADMLTYGSTGQLHLDIKHLGRVYIPVIDSYKSVADNMKIAVEQYENKAWKAYFEAMKIVEEYFKHILTKLTEVSKLTIAKEAGRFDGAGLLALSLLSKIAEHFSNSIELHNMFEIVSGNVPRSEDYRGVRGIPYITIDSIDDSGVIDEEKMTFIPREKYKKSFVRTRNRDVLLVKDGIGSLGKVAIALGEYPVMSGIYILRSKAIKDELLSYYVIAVLKTRFYRKIMEMMSYGTTGQISLAKHDVEKILVPVLDNYRDVGNLFKEFVENMYQANVLKKQAVMELENYILKLIS